MKASAIHLRQLLPVIAVVVACGGGDGGNGVAGPDGSAVDVTGGWIYQGNLTSQVFFCRATVSLQLTQSGNTVTGTYGAFNTGCFRTDDGDPLNVPSASFTAGQIRNGRMDGSTLSFDFNPNWHNTGTVFTNTVGQAFLIEGSLNTMIDFGPSWGTLTFTNNSWTAVR